MQFIENSIIGVRAACIRLSAGPEAPDVCLFPMIHIGSSAYYAEVRRRLSTCDVVLFEGVRSFRAWMITRAYSIATHNKRLGLVQQRHALPVATLSQRKIHADVSTDQFHAAWADIPWYQRALLFFGAPLFGLWLYFTGTRQSIGRRLNTEEVELNRDFERFELRPELEKMFATTRDLRLVDEVAKAVETSGVGTRIAVLYGAAHMRIVSRLLTGKYRYRVVESEWIMVFDYQE
ncbi:MAG TPA: hypothetical protein VGD45_14195 [Steroidobacter sp.]|uniref:hypothetical protein n=1 Tax=Steroidobacter sp. TaxID=1978227 RepID=UPI002EDA85E6